VQYIKQMYMFLSRAVQIAGK